VLTEELLLLSHDFQNDSYLLALDKATGELVWKADLPEAHKNHYNSTSYSTPLVMNNQVILHRAMEISSYSVEDGSRLWWIPISTSGVSSPIFYRNTLCVGAWQEFGEKKRRLDIPDFESMISTYDINGDKRITAEEIPGDITLLSRPEMTEVEGTSVTLAAFFGIYDRNADGTIDKDEWVETTDWLVSFYGESGLLALRPDANEDRMMPQVLWKETEQLAEVPSPIYYEGRVYMIKNGGIITCVEAESGALKYRERLGVPGPYLASPIEANDKIYIPSNNGIITVIKASDQLEILAKNDLGEKIFSSPAVIGNVLYVRTSEKLFAFKE
jgi:outer membrane protein assembly factor BamB